MRHASAAQRADAWAKRDSNPRHPACKAGALNQLSYSPGDRREARALRARSPNGRDAVP